jgi:hypothetical protein
MEWIIVPNVGAGAIEFGMSRGQVRSLLPGGYSEHPTEGVDWFNRLSLKVCYDPLGKCTAIVMDASHSPILFNERILSMQYGELQSWIRELDADAWMNDDYVFSRRLGVVLGSSSGILSRPAEGVNVFAPNAWQDWYPNVESMM